MERSKSSTEHDEQRIRELSFDQVLCEQEARTWAPDDVELQQMLNEFGRNLLRKFRRRRLGENT